MQSRSSTKQRACIALASKWPWCTRSDKAWCGVADPSRSLPLPAAGTCRRDGPGDSGTARGCPALSSPHAGAPAGKRCRLETPLQPPPLSSGPRGHGGRAAEPPGALSPDKAERGRGAARPGGPRHRRGSCPGRPRARGQCWGRRGGGGAALPGPRGREESTAAIPPLRGRGSCGRDTPALGRHAAPGGPSPTCSDGTQPGASPHYRPRLIVLLLPPPPFPRRRRLSPRSCQVPPFTWARDGRPLPPFPPRYGRRYANGAPPPPLPPVPTGAAQRPRRNPAPRMPPCADRTLRIPHAMRGARRLAAGAG
ncbi:proline-rich protein HaeIII subfamily 1-like [Pseudopipra pipra]|uniref:proline-rich protein HaeIII subfamily 1-like n=1 Tax=Pseudopipra pipra TaxID=415032 RepID=UPI003138BCCF